MENLVWILWTILGIVLVVAEVFTSGFVLLWFGLGALAAGAVGLIGAGVALQFLTFFIVSIALTALSRTIFNSYFTKSDATRLKTGVDALPGKIGVVVAPSAGALREAAVKVSGSTWTAYPVEGEELLEMSDQVIIESVRGASIYVRRVATLRAWHDNALPAQENEDFEHTPRRLID